MKECVFNARGSTRSSNKYSLLLCHILTASRKHKALCSMSYGGKYAGAGGLSLAYIQHHTNNVWHINSYALNATFVRRELSERNGETDTAPYHEHSDTCIHLLVLDKIFYTH
jgi:hypothetical protein